jgi:iron complex transport system ATP-binding protein
VATKTTDRLDVKSPRFLEVENLGFAVGGIPLLRDVSFSLGLGEVLAVVGPNGAGKSTLLKCLASEIHPTGGTIRVRGQLLQDLHHSQTARWRAVLPQANRIPFAFTAREIVLLGRSPHVLGTESARDLEIVDAALAATDASHLAGRSVQTLSGGELQRVHMARVLAQIWEDPASHGRLLLLDEPTSALDLKHQHSLLNIARKWAERGTAVLVILHDLNLAARYADSLLWLHSGTQVAHGPPGETITSQRIREVFEVPASIHYFENDSLMVRI